MKWDPSIWNYGRSMDKYCKVKDIVSSKCHKEMNGTWIANLYCLTVLLGGVHTLVAWPCTKCHELYAHSSSLLDAKQLKVLMETHWKQKNRQKTQRRLNWMRWNVNQSVGWSDVLISRFVGWIQRLEFSKVTVGWTDGTTSVHLMS
jgi:hypothetical protein